MKHMVTLSALLTACGTRTSPHVEPPPSSRPVKCQDAPAPANGPTFFAEASTLRFGMSGGPDADGGTEELASTEIPGARWILTFDDAAELVKVVLDLGKLNEATRQTRLQAVFASWGKDIAGEWYNAAQQIKARRTDSTIVFERFSPWRAIVGDTPGRLSFLDTSWIGRKFSDIWEADGNHGYLSFLPGLELVLPATDLGYPATIRFATDVEGRLTSFRTTLNHDGQASTRDAILCDIVAKWGIPGDKLVFQAGDQNVKVHEVARAVHVDVGDFVGDSISCAAGGGKMCNPVAPAN